MQHSFQEMRAMLRRSSLKRAATMPPPMDPSGMPMGVPPPAPMPGAPPATMPGAPPPMDPSMAGGAMGAMPPVDPSMMAGLPPQGMPMPPMDPSMMGGAPPMDPSMGGGMPFDPAMLAAAASPPIEAPPQDDAGDSGDKRKGESADAMMKEVLSKLDALAERMSGLEDNLRGMTEADLAPDLQDAPPLPEPDALDLSALGPKTASAEIDPNSKPGRFSRLLLGLVGR